MEVPPRGDSVREGLAFGVLAGALGGAAIGLVTGAATDASLGESTGYSALIGAGIGAAMGAIGDARTPVPWVAYDSFEGSERGFIDPSAVFSGPGIGRQSGLSNIIVDLH